MLYHNYSKCDDHHWTDHSNGSITRCSRAQIDSQNRRDTSGVLAAVNSSHGFRVTSCKSQCTYLALDLFHRFAIDPFFLKSVSLDLDCSISTPLSLRSLTYFARSYRLPSVVRAQNVQGRPLSGGNLFGQFIFDSVAHFVFAWFVVLFCILAFLYALPVKTCETPRPFSSFEYVGPARSEPLLAQARMAGRLCHRM